MSTYLYPEAVLKELYQVVKEELQILNRPGLGLDWGEAALNHYQIV